MESINLTFRTTLHPGDEKSVREILSSTGFFYPIEIPIGVQLVEEKLIEGAACSYQFIFADHGNQSVAYSCFGLIPGTEQSFDLYWIATHNDFRGKGIGRTLLEETHRSMAAQGGLTVVAETSSLEKYQPTRHFYETMGYTQAGMIPDFYKRDDAKIIYVKRL